MERKLSTAQLHVVHSTFNNRLSLNPDKQTLYRFNSSKNRRKRIARSQKRFDKRTDKMDEMKHSLLRRNA